MSNRILQEGAKTNMAKKKKAMQSSIRHLITKINPKSPISEQYRTIRTNVQFSDVDKDIKSLLITSSEPEAGKSMTAANLAIVYGQQGIKTLLIDADMRKPTMHYTFRLENLTGLSNALVDNTSFETVAISSDVENLDIIPSGPIPPNPSELLASNRFKELYEEAYEVYDMIIVDTPPIIAVTDAQIVANMLDGVIIVARSGQTEVEHLKQSVQLIEKVQGNLLGTVLNDVEKVNSGNYYYYYGS